MRWLILVATLLAYPFSPNCPSSAEEVQALQDQCEDAGGSLVQDSDGSYWCKDDESDGDESVAIDLNR